MGKHEEMSKKVGTSSSIDQMLTSKNLPYSVEVMGMPLPPKFRVPQIYLYNISKDPLVPKKCSMGMVRVIGTKLNL